MNLLPDTVAGLYLGCFLIGTVLVLLTSVSGVGHHATHGIEHGVSHGLGGHHGDLHGGDADPSPFNLQTILAFITFFGGVGYALRIAGTTGPIGLIGAVLGGLAGGSIVFFVLVRFLYGKQTPYLDEADFALPGTIAKVTSSIAEHGTGEIVFFKAGSQRVEGARAVGGVPIERGREVVILNYDRGIAEVEPLDI